MEINDSWKKNNIYYLIVEIPDYINEELYNLTIFTLIENKYYYCNRPRSVKVIEKYEDNFSFIHITDLHVGDPRGFSESIKETIGFKSVKKCISEINLLNPDFVIISGDLVFGQLYFKEYSREYKKCYEMIQMFDVPTFLVPGNHDGYRRFREDGLEFWKTYFGPLYYSFDYGNYHFQAINSYDWPEIYRWSIGPIVLTWGGYIKDKQLDWIERDLKNNSEANLLFMFLHHNPLWDTKKETLISKSYHNRQELLNLINNYEVDMVLAGHTHIDNITIVNDTIFAVTTTPESHISIDNGYWGYRKIDIENGVIVRYNYKEPKFSIPSYKIHINYENINTANVENLLEEDIEILVKFTVPNKNYMVENADILNIRENDLYKQYYLKAIIPSEDKITISLKSII